MALKRYRFRNAAVDPVVLAQQMPSESSAMIVAATPCIISVLVDCEEAYLGDLKEFMDGQKWSFDAEVPLSASTPQLIMAAENSGVLYNVAIDDSSGTPEIKITAL